MKKIGKIYFFLFVLVSSLVYCESLDIQLYSADGTKLKTALIGVPFFVDIILRDSDKNYSELTVDGLDKLKLLNNKPEEKIESLTINGKHFKTRRFIFHVMAEKAGTFIIGPAKFKENNNLWSKTVKLQVKSGNNNQNEKIQCILKLESEKVYIGQKVSFTIKFLTLDSEVKFKNIELPEWENIRIISLEEAKHYTESVNGKNAFITEFRGSLVADKIGDFLLLPIKARYLVKTKTISNFFLSSFFSNQKIKELYSNSINLKVLPLPYHPNNIDAVGKFKNFNLTVDPKETYQFQPISLTLSVEGFGVLEDIKHPKLKLPKSFKVYESSSSIKKSDTGLYDIKSFEYILQPLNDGELEIPEQIFTFFDFDTKEFKILRTEPLKINIKKNLNKDLNYKNKNEDFLNEESLDQEKDSDLGQIIDFLKHNIKEQIYIPWFLFFLLIGLPILLYFIVFIAQLFVKLKRKKYSLLSKYILKDACKKLYYSFKKGCSNNWYDIIKQSLSLFLTGKKIILSDDDIVDYLKKYKYYPELIQKYQSLNYDLLRCTFYNCDNLNNQEKEKLFQELILWIKNLKDATNNEKK